MVKKGVQAESVRGLQANARDTGLPGHGILL